MVSLSLRRCGGSEVELERVVEVRSFRNVPQILKELVKAMLLDPERVVGVRQMGRYLANRTVLVARTGFRS